LRSPFTAAKAAASTSGGTLERVARRETDPHGGPLDDVLSEAESKKKQRRRNDEDDDRPTQPVKRDELGNRDLAVGLDSTRDRDTLARGDEIFELTLRGSKLRGQESGIDNGEALPGVLERRGLDNHRSNKGLMSQTGTTRRITASNRS